MWKGRFQQKTAQLLEQYGESISFDKRLYECDIRGSIAHAKAQQKAGLLTNEELTSIEQGLLEIQQEITAGEFVVDYSLEDIHMHIEARLSQKIGSLGGKLHTARSRNDQVATDTRLYCRDMIDLLSDLLKNLQKVLVDLAERHSEDAVAGYTHLQRGQPVTIGHHLLAYVEMFARDQQRLQETRARVNICPLGSGALAGSTINLDRDYIANLLGFASITQNSMDAISDRDYLLDLLYNLAMIGMHLSRLSEDLILWSSSEFSFIQLSDAHTTGSSLMPQKKNPDICEITRGKTGRLYGNLISVLTVIKGLPLTYNRDLQEDKEPLFDSIDTIELALRIHIDMLEQVSFNTSQCLQSAQDPLLLATDLADFIVQQGIPFRQAHEIVGSAVATALNNNILLSEVDFSHVLSAEACAKIPQLFHIKNALQARTNVGSPNPKRTAERIAYWQQQLT